MTATDIALIVAAAGAGGMGIGFPLMLLLYWIMPSRSRNKALVLELAASHKINNRLQSENGEYASLLVHLRAEVEEGVKREATAEEDATRQSGNATRAAESITRMKEETSEAKSQAAALQQHAWGAELKAVLSASEDNLYDLNKQLIEEQISRSEYREKVAKAMAPIGPRSTR